MDFTSGVKQAADELVPILNSIIGKIPDDIRGLVENEVSQVLSKASEIVEGVEASLAKDEENFLVRMEGITTRIENLVRQFDGASVTVNFKKGEVT